MCHIHINQIIKSNATHPSIISSHCPPPLKFPQIRICKSANKHDTIGLNPHAHLRLQFNFHKSHRRHKLRELFDDVR